MRTLYKSFCFAKVIIRLCVRFFEEIFITSMKSNSEGAR